MGTPGALCVPLAGDLSTRQVVLDGEFHRLRTDSMRARETAEATDMGLSVVHSPPISSALLCALVLRELGRDPNSQDQYPET